MINQSKCVGILSVLVVVTLTACGDGPSPQVAVGTLERDRIELVSEVFEPITKILALEGEVVAAGDTLIEIDDRRAQIALGSAKAQEAAQAALVAELEEGPRHERIKAARAGHIAAKEAVIEADRALKRAESLLKDEVFSVAARDGARLTLARAVAERDGLAAQLEELEQGTRDETLNQAHARLRQFSLAVDDAKLRLDRLAVKAPRPGRIEALPFEVGERPGVGGKVVVMLADGAPYARVYVPESVRAQLNPGAKAQVTIEGVAKTYTGTLRYVASDAAFTPFFALTDHDRGQLTYLAEIDLEEAQDLPTGLPVEVRFIEGTKK
jgi:HlyD family secretion protein